MTINTGIGDALEGIHKMKVQLFTELNRLEPLFASMPAPGIKAKIEDAEDRLSVLNKAERLIIGPLPF